MKQFLREDAGAALVTVLLIIMVMSAGVALTLDSLTYSMKRSVAVQVYSQARLYAKGGEQMAQEAAEQLFDTDQKLKAAVGTGEKATVSFPLDQGGYIRGYLRDASNCFNINSLVTVQDRGVYILDEANALYYQRLLIHLGFAPQQAETLVVSLVDWIDSDSRPTRGGAEDYEYSGLSIPYRAANSLLADITELRLVKGYSTDVIERIDPYICAVSKAERNPLNVNTLTPDHAPLLAALVGESLSLNNAARLIAERPGQGYGSVAGFWTEQVFEGMNLTQETRSSVNILPSLYFAEISVKYLDADVKLSSLLKMESDGSSTVISRRYGALF